MSDDLSEVYNRTNILKGKINVFLKDLTGNKRDYLDSLDQSQLIAFKSALSDINNVLTLKLSLAAIQWMQSFFSINQSETETLRQVIDATKPNTNGFDIEINGKQKIVAEIKCIVPINNGSGYGAAQRNGILDDANKLIAGKRKTPDTSAYIKIIGLLDLGEKSDEAIRKLSIPAKNIRTKMQIRLDRHDAVKRLRLITDDMKAKDLTTEFVYIKKLRI